MINIKSYIFIYKILFDYVKRSAINFFFQFVIHRYIEFTSLLVAVVASVISISNSHLIILAIALAHLFPSIILNEGYVKIVPYARIIYLDNRVISIFLICNTMLPFIVYLTVFGLFSTQLPSYKDILSMSILLFNNALFAHFLHLFSFSFKAVFPNFVVIVAIYAIFLINAPLLYLLAITLGAVILFYFKMNQY